MAKSALHRLLGQAGKGPKMVEPKDPEFAERCPNLFALMTEMVGPDGGKRQTCSVSLFAEDGVFKACLSERDLLLNLWVSSEGFDGLWDALEEKLSADPVEWRPKPGQAKNGRGR